MAEGFQIEVFGDSSLFTGLGKGVSYLARAGETHYLLDCGATPFLALGHEGVKRLGGLVATHSHEDHRRWFTDLVLYLHYHPDIGRRLRLMTSEAIHEEYEMSSRGALERSLSADRRRVVEVPYSEFVEKVVIGPRAKYRIECRPAPRAKGGEGHVWRVIEAATGEPVPPSLGKVFVNPAADRPRMLFKDPDSGEWVEPASHYPFSSAAFYESDRNDFVDEESGLTFRAVNAPTWHGPPTIGVVVARGGDRAAFSSDTVYDPELWRELAETKHPLPPEADTAAFREACVVYDDINRFIERTWSRARLDEAVKCYDGMIVIHDADFERSVVHTAHSKFTPDSDWRRLVLTHTPDGFASVYPMTCKGKRYLVADGDIFELVGDERFPLDAGLYLKAAGRDRAEDGSLLVGYRRDEGVGRLWATPNGLAVEIGHDRPPGGADGGKAEFLGRYELFFDIGGRYFPAAPVIEGRGTYRARADGSVELLTETAEGSTGAVVESVRGKIPRSG